MNYDKENIYLAKVRYLDKDKGEFNTDIDVYTFLQKKDGQYVNLFHPELDYPVYEYAYSKYSDLGNENGAYLNRVQGDIKDGLSYVVQKTDIRGIFKTIYDIEQFMLYSSEFFIDRIDVINKRITLMEAGKLKNDLFDLEQYRSFKEMDKENYCNFMNSINNVDRHVVQKKK